MDTIPVIMGIMSCDSMNNCFLLFHNQSLRKIFHMGNRYEVSEKSPKIRVKMALFELECFVKQLLK